MLISLSLSLSVSLSPCLFVSLSVCFFLCQHTCPASTCTLMCDNTHSCVLANACQCVTSLVVCAYNTMQRTATHCNALQRTATHCNALQRTATHCNALQRTAPHCNALQRTTTCQYVMSLICVCSNMHTNM